MEAPAEFGWRFADSKQRRFECLHEFGGGVWSPVGEDGSRLVPDCLVRVEFGRVRGKGFESKAPLATQESPHGLSLVTAAVVEDHDDEASKVSQQVAEERGHVDVVKVLARQTAEVQTDPLLPGADRQCRDDRDLLAFLVVVEDRRLPSHGPGAANGRDQDEAAFVEEDDVGAQVFGVFLHAATPRSSSAGCAPRRAPARGDPASGN